MKKILAALLVVVMVVSLFPATVFAAPSSGECKVVEEYGAHSKAHCDALGVKYTQFGETVKPECGQDGYTTYKCDACGAYFADDIIDMPDHEYEYGAKPVTARVEPTCSAYGKAAFFTCIHCNELFPVYMDTDVIPEDESAPAGAIEKVKHTFADNSYPGNDCTAKTQICTVCGEEVKNKNPNKAHDFDYSDPHAITKAPGTCGHGEATFKCTNEGCEVTKVVKVNFTGHDETEIGDQLKFVKEKASTCTKTGVKEHYKCEECDALFAYDKDGKFVPVTAEDLVIEETHSWGDEPTRTDLPTCEKYGADYYLCILCGKTKIENEVAPLGHTTFEEAVAHDADKKLVEKDGKWITVVKATGCTDRTTYTWTCHKECYCNADPADPEKAVCGKVLTKKDAAKGHEEVTINVPATVLYPAYTMIVCTDPNCDIARVEGVQELTVSGKEYELNVSVKVVDGDVYELTEAEKEAVHFVKVTKVSGKKTSKCGAHYYKYNETNFAPTCTTTGEDVYICVSDTCGYDAKVVTTAALGHVYDYENDYKCGVKHDLLCTRCGSGKISFTAAKAVHKLSDEFAYTVKVPNCAEAAGDYYYCEYCDEPVVDTESEGYKKYAYDSLYDSYEEAENAHANGTLTVIDNTTYPGSCTVVGKIEYKCSECEEEFWVADTENTGFHVPPAGTVYHKEATCHNGQGYETYTCTECQKEVKAAAPLDHILSELIPAKKATCTTDGNVAYYTCSRECCAYTVLDENGDPVLDENGEEVKAPGAVIFYEEEYTDKNGLLKTRIIYIYVGDVENVTLPALEHKLENGSSAYEDTTVVANCTTPGFVHHICTLCGDEYVDGYEKATGHKKGTADKLAATCTQDGHEFYACKNPGCTGDNGIVDGDFYHGGDDGIYTDSKITVVIKPALGHINAAGQVFYNKCTDTTKDRVCVRANCDDVTLDSKGNRKPIGKDHAMTDWTYVEECCEHEGYYVRVCENDCGVKELEIVEDALGHLFAWDERAGLEYVNASDVAYYGNWYLEHYYRFKEEYGADAILAYTPATYEKKGSITFTCADCGDVVTMDVQYVPVEFTIELDNALVAGANDIKDVNGETVYFLPNDGDIISVDINMNAFEVGVWGFNFDFYYDASAVNYLGYTFHANDIFKTTMFNHYYEDVNEYYDVNNDGVEELVYTNENAYGVVKVLAYNDKKEDTTITGTEKVVTLYFQVDAYYEYTELGRKQSDIAEYFYYGFYDGAVTNAKGEYVLADGELEGEAYIAGLMDANLDGSFNVDDIYVALDTVLAGEGYVAGADIDKDGVVTVDDIYAMCDYMMGKQDVDALIAVILARKPWTAPEGFVAA